MTSGPDIAGTTRDTGVVLRELFAEAEHHVLVVGFAVHQGREIFAALAHRMHQRAGLAVRLCLDVRRPPGDTTRSDALLRRFAERFVRQEWPGPRLPEVFLASATARARIEVILERCGAAGPRNTVTRDYLRIASAMMTAAIRSRSSRVAPALPSNPRRKAAAVKSGTLTTTATVICPNRRRLQ